MSPVVPTTTESKCDSNAQSASTATVGVSATVAGKATLALFATDPSLADAPAVLICEKEVFVQSPFEAFAMFDTNVGPIRQVGEIIRNPSLYVALVIEKSDFTYVSGSGPVFDLEAGGTATLALESSSEPTAVAPIQNNCANAQSGSATVTSIKVSTDVSGKAILGLYAYDPLLADVSAVLVCKKEVQVDAPSKTVRFDVAVGPIQQAGMTVQSPSVYVALFVDESDLSYATGPGSGPVFDLKAGRRSELKLKGK